MATIHSLHIYPIKSMAGIEIPYAQLDQQGIQFETIKDRQWMVTDQQYRLLSQREIQKMALIKTQIVKGKLIISYKNSQITINPQENKPLKIHQCKIWRDTVEAIDCGDKISNWLTQHLGQWLNQNLRLVRLSNNHQRTVENNTYFPSLKVNPTIHFADEYPYLITSIESLNVLQQYINQNNIMDQTSPNGIKMNRFRPNIVLQGVQPFAEDKDLLLSHPNGDYQLNLVKPCRRCRLITFNQETAVENPDSQPLNLLRDQSFINFSNRFQTKQPFFGNYAVLTKGNNPTIKKNDTINIL